MYYKHESEINASEEGKERIWGSSSFKIAIYNYN